MNEEPETPPQPVDTLIAGAVISAFLGLLALFVEGIGDPPFLFGLAVVLATAGAVRRIRHSHHAPK